MALKEKTRKKKRKTVSWKNYAMGRGMPGQAASANFPLLHWPCAERLLTM
jgi:hypothetical protein